MKNIIRTDRIGYITKNTFGHEMKCIEYYNAKDITVEFENGHIAYNITWQNFINGKVRSQGNNSYNIHNRNSLYNITDEYGKITKEYYTWFHMLERCKDKDWKDKKPTYQECNCCEEWLSFENFYIWLHSQDNFKIWKSLKWSALDKDILIKGNKIYSPNTCLLVPISVNSLFVKRDFYRGDYPVGVFYQNGKYKATCADPFLNNPARNLGTFLTMEEAFLRYKTYKEDIIKRIAEIEYAKGTITKQCRDALIAYKVEIND